MSPPCPLGMPVRLEGPPLLQLVFLLRRFCSQAALTPEEREQRALYAAILEYEQDHVSRLPPGHAEGRQTWGHTGL